MMELQRNALVLMLLVIWSVPVIPAPIPENCASHFEQGRRIVNLLHLKATDLKNTYLKKHRINNVDIPDEAPTSTVTGSSLLEKLEDVYTKNRLFKLHISQVKTYQEELLSDPKPLPDDLKGIELKLSHLLHVLENTLGCLDLMTRPSTSPSLPDMANLGDYSKKVYGWGVIVRLIEWLDEVKIVLPPRKLKKIANENNHEDLKWFSQSFLSNQANNH